MGAAMLARPNGARAAVCRLRVLLRTHNISLLPPVEELFGTEQHGGGDSSRDSRSTSDDDGGDDDDDDNDSADQGET